MITLVTATVLLLHSLHGNAIEFTENGYPILWDKVPGLFTELPSVDGTFIINPWNYLQRMSMYKILINATDVYMKSMGPGNTESPLWGFPLQLGWKRKSGRLVDPTGASLCGQESGDAMCISPQSWWACVNYYLSVIPFLAAVETGIVGQGLQIQIQAPSETAQDYCLTYSDCLAKHSDLMTKWVAFFQSLKNLSTFDIPDSEKKDQILGLMWSAQQSSLSASASCNTRQAHYSAPEVSFSQSWINSADYVAATHFQSNIENSKLFMSPLPSRVLREGDSPPHIPDLSAEENHTLQVFGWMRNMNTLLGGSLVQMWRSAMCSESSRVKGQAVLQGLVLDPTFAISGILGILHEMAKTC
ncbi:hypothetical protein JZ751_005035 [Albula glossodonta]|uniref:Protein LEG1 homolog n=1 Tax=Albula glossodonta TaxID=121402 RepID=A0A8T2PD84_9TELE|nr:hypothetical protein JZ751_005035 [Albula glossodonta]